MIAYPDNHAPAGAELYDPATGVWTSTGSLNNGCCNHPATLLPNGQVLAAGDEVYETGFGTTAIYDPGTGTWTTTGSLNVARYYCTATLLPNGLGGR